MNEVWTASSGSNVVTLQREVDCLFCCKRKRADCRNCGGLGRTTLVYQFSSDAARALHAELGRALGLG